MKDTPNYVYILTNKKNTVLYTGVTSNLTRRVEEHRGRLVNGHTKRYNIEKLVYYEVHEDANSANIREKQLKAGSRIKKIKLITKNNIEWKDLSSEIGVCI